MVADVVSAVAGSNATVTTLMGPGIDPHLYQATRDDLKKLAAADIIFQTGLDLEGRMAKVLRQFGTTKPVIEITADIPRDQLLVEADSKDHPDPHVWMDPTLWSSTADTVAVAMTKLHPDRISEYQVNASRYKANGKLMADYARMVSQSIPRDRRILITSHDAFGYLGRSLDIQVRGIQGLSTESEAGLKDINTLVDLVVKKNIPAVFIESTVPSRSVKAIVEGAAARGHTVVIGGELYSDAMGPEGTYEGTYQGMLDHNITTITRALGGSVPNGGFRQFKAESMAGSDGQSTR